MIPYIKAKLSSGWHFMRILRIAFAIIFAIQAVIMKDYLVGLMSVFFLYQGITNRGCCGEQCNPTIDNTSQQSNLENVNFEEIKQ